MRSPVLAALAQARMRAAPMFAKWCELNGVTWCPAAPADVARFVADGAALGIERLWPAVQEISRAHSSLGLADPTLGGLVAAAINQVGGIAPPRSWPDDRKQRFTSLPHDLQVYVAAHEVQREKALRRAQHLVFHCRPLHRLTCSPWPAADAGHTLEATGALRLCCTAKRECRK